MALRKIMLKRLHVSCRVITPTLEHSPFSPSPYSEKFTVPPNAAKSNSHREYMSSPESGEKGFFRRFFHRQSVTKLPDFLTLPLRDKLRESLKGVNITGDRLRIDDLPPPVPVIGDSPFGLSVQDARKLMRLAQVEKLKAKLREIPESTISYSDFVQICVNDCGNEDQGVDFAKMLDQSGNVIVLGNSVFLRPEQIAQSMERVISQSFVSQNDPRRKQLEQMENQKALIDKKARALVRGELYCGLGFLTAQLMAAMRLTFWELSWDVMEPICFFATSLHFGIGYLFFLKTSTEPTFEGFFRRRFEAKQKKLFKTHNFDIEKYNELVKLFNPKSRHGLGSSQQFKSDNHGGSGFPSLKTC
ncbi:calcium uniporter protein 4 mitochondrial [Tripterygium wilfordii]|uniref:Calcium uniporter protein 4 mitochondrial n=1 Tax=Tripterygium wilfordii TaxID=458696 RepID=A0A7J7D320_TRIWF|nr:calcium uniporter protein 4, mitochondrial-like [Tripterygium wilfordii]KAF5740745.1 calcium uniporter protein 4 mitochondrial [Tripterygium wilfordii]